MATPTLPTPADPASTLSALSTPDTTRIPPPARGVARPAAPGRLGLRLLAAIDLVLPDLSEPGVTGELAAGLAWAAAAGETCRITRPVDGVRSAVAAIRAGELGAARGLLEHAAAELRDAPALPVPRPATGVQRRSI
ncbi:hypothetical protein [Actinokineospora inagensis]|uniref:hypothetical protein n=1 Tax=Actinokineospora inagensis TaxID=103730 RepID=UPI000413E77F|nr:hypothetical protein [Actinokineospora inagensis]